MNDLEILAGVLALQRLQFILTQSSAAKRHNVMLASAVLVSTLLAQAAPAQAPAAQGPVFKMDVTARTTRAVNYRVRSGSTNIDFQGTSLLPNAKGRGVVEPRSGSYAISANFEKLVPPQTFGKEYMTYVAWAITPEGRPTNLGEVALDGTKARFQGGTELQVFGIIVTAEPYYAVITPSETVVLENIVRSDTYGTNMPIDAKFEALTKASYDAAKLPPAVQSGKRKIPNDLFQARNAVQIAKWSGAENWAKDTLQRAQTALTNAEGMQTTPKNYDSKKVVSSAREAIQAAEDARALAVKRAEDARIAKEQADAAARTAEAQKRQQEEEAARLKAEEARRQSELDAARAAAAQQKAEAEKMAARLREEQAKNLAEKSAADAAAADAARKKVIAEQQALRKRLLDQFNSILETKDTPRGLVVNMGDVLFDTGRFNLRPPAREALAKLSGIVLAYSSLRLDIEGHTDSTGTDAINDKLSQDRANEVLNYLLGQRVPASQLTAKGFGSKMPVGDNSTAQGRQQNRRVEIVVSGEVIGTQIGTNTN